MREGEGERDEGEVREVEGRGGRDGGKEVFL